MDWTLSHNDVIDKVIEIEQSFLNPIAAYSSVIHYLQDLLWTYSERVRANGFMNSDEEILFFKTIKTQPLSYLIQYKKQLEFELDNNHSTSQLNIDKVALEVQSSQDFIAKHHIFLIYMETNRIDQDEYYFLRNIESNFSISSASALNYDRFFCTAYDCLWAEILGNKYYIKYLNEKLPASGNTLTSATRNRNFNWTASKVALTELAIALKHSGSINNGNISFKDTVHFLQDIFSLDLGEFNHTAMRMKNRSNATKYIDSLKVSVEKWIENTDE